MADPTATAAPNQARVEPGTTLTSAVVASDADGDTLTYTATIIITPKG